MWYDRVFFDKFILRGNYDGVKFSVGFFIIIGVIFFVFKVVYVFWGYFDFFYKLY